MQKLTKKKNKTRNVSKGTEYKYAYYLEAHFIYLVQSVFDI